MMYNVPQFIDVEDKIAGPLTWRQLGWVIGAFMISFIIWSSVGGVLAFVLIIPIILLASALAFYRPNGQPMIGFLVHGFYFLMRPKIVVRARRSAASRGWWTGDDANHEVRCSEKHKTQRHKMPNKTQNTNSESTNPTACHPESFGLELMVERCSRGISVYPDFSTRGLPARHADARPQRFA